MSKKAFFTDPHLGLDRIAHTTTRSRRLLSDHLLNLTLGMIENLKELSPGIGFVCLGDLFDRYSNKEEVISEGARVARECEAVLGGNHDQINQSDEIGSLELLKIFFENSNTTIITAEPRDMPYCEFLHDAEAKTVYCFVPHAMSQGLFEHSLVQANTKAEMHKDVTKILCLHCNVGLPHEHDLRETQTSLWFTEEMQLEALKYFDFILIGHEHVPQAFHNNRMLVLGNVYPVGFGEIHDRFVYIYDSEKKSIEPIATVKMSEEFTSITADELIGSEGRLETDARLVDITGRIKLADYAAFSRAIQNFWKTNEDLFLVRDLVDRETVAKPEIVREAFVQRSLRDIVGDSVKTTEFREVYEEIAAAVENTKEPAD